MKHLDAGRASLLCAHKITFPRGSYLPDFNSMMTKADKLFISLLVKMPAISKQLNPLLRVFSGVRCVIGGHQLLSLPVQFLVLFFLI